MLAASEAESASEKADLSIHEGRREAHTWSFRACVRLKDGQTFSNLLDARKQQLDTSLASASVISWACTNTAPFEFQDCDGVHLEGFVHASTIIRLGSLKHVFPEKQSTDAGEIVEAAFPDVKPCPCKDYMCHPTIKTFLEETSLDPLASDKRKRVDYRGSSTSNSVIIRALTWFGRGMMGCADLSQVEAIFRSENVAHRQQATIRSAQAITFACESAASSTVQVEVLVHSSETIRRVKSDTNKD